MPQKKNVSLKTKYRSLHCSLRYEYNILQGLLDPEHSTNLPTFLANWPDGSKGVPEFPFFAQDCKDGQSSSVVVVPYTSENGF